MLLYLSFNNSFFNNIKDYQKTMPTPLYPSSSVEYHTNNTGGETVFAKYYNNFKLKNRVRINN